MEVLFMYNSKSKQFRVVDPAKGFTVMSNYHLRDKDLSLKARGLLSFMLSLPPDWDYSIKGLMSFCHKDGRDAIMSALQELEKVGYLKRERVRRPNGTFATTYYTVSAYPMFQEGEIAQVKIEPKSENPTLASKASVSIRTDDTPKLDYPTSVNPPQQSKEYEQNKERKNKEEAIASMPQAATLSLSKFNLDGKTKKERAPRRRRGETGGRDIKPPTLAEVMEYVKANNLNVDADYFYKYYSARNGKFPKNWQQKALSWSQNERKNYRVHPVKNTATEADIENALLKQQKEYEAMMRANGEWLGE